MRLEITRKAHLATRAITVLAAQRARQKGAELARQLDASPGFLAQAMTPLVDAGWVRSEPGPTGGYLLAVDPATVTARDVIEAVEGPTDTTGCVVEDRPCADGDHCAMHVPWTTARSLLLRQLETITLATMASGETQPLVRSATRG